MLFNIGLAKNKIYNASYFYSFWLILLILLALTCTATTQIFNPSTELENPTGILTKEAAAEMENIQ